MKSTGIIRRIDDLGRIVIPLGLRKSLSIEEGDAFEYFTEDDKVILRKYKPVDAVKNAIAEAKLGVKDYCFLPTEKSVKILKKLIEIENIMKGDD